MNGTMGKWFAQKILWHLPHAANPSPRFKSMHFSGNGTQCIGSILWDLVTVLVTYHDQTQAS